MEVKVQRHQLDIFYPHYLALMVQLLHLMSLHWHTSITVYISAQSWCKCSPFGQIFPGIKPPPPQCPTAQFTCPKSLLPVYSSSSPLQYLATTGLFTVVTLLSSPQRCIVGNTPYVAFADWLLLLPSIKYVFMAWGFVSLYHHILYITIISRFMDVPQFIYSTP